MNMESLERRQLFAIELAAGYSISELPGAPQDVTASAFLPDGRLVSVRKGGEVRLMKGGSYLPNAIYSVTTDTAGERGLGGVAADPAFATNGFVYLYYTSKTGGMHNRLVRITLSQDTVVSGSETLLLRLPKVTSAVHNGGALQFGPDGMLYVGVGDNRQRTKVQDVKSPFGKVLRVKPDGTAPGDNPFKDVAGKGENGVRWQDLVWARGLRNPFTMAFEADASRITGGSGVGSGGGLMLINDVGEETVEEVNLGVAGANYGWPKSEGPTTAAGESTPFFSLLHIQGVSAFTGGAFAAPEDGGYYFNDFVSGVVRRLDVGTGATSVIATGVDLPLDVDLGPDRALYISTIGGRVFKLERSTGPTAGVPGIVHQPDSVTAAIGNTVTFTVGAAGDPNGGVLSYQWQKDGVDLPGATESVFSRQVSAGDNGSRYRVVVTNDRGSTTSASALLTVDANRPPVPVITTPKAGTTYAGGSRVSLRFTATDPDQKSVPTSAYSYKVVFHHGDHTHPFVADVAGKKSATIVIPNDGELATDVFYRVHLKVTDEKGFSTEVVRDITPRLATLRITSNLPALNFNLDSVPTAAPTEFSGVAGLLRSISYPREVVLDGITWRLSKGARGKLMNGEIVFAFPAKNTEISLVYKQVSR